MYRVSDLASHIERAPHTMCVARSSDNYDELLELYLQVGYGPSRDTDQNLWKERSKSSWRYIDTLLPGTTTVGKHDGRIISSFGTMPLTPNLLYTHSGCMLKSLSGAATLFAQTLVSLSCFDRLPEMMYLGMGYSYSSRFTTQFQRPRDFTIPFQIECESVLCCPGPSHTNAAVSTAHLTECASEFSALLHPAQRWIFDSLRWPYPKLMERHTIKTLAVRSATNDILLALLVEHDGPPFLTAADVHREVIVFPLPAANLSDLCEALRSIPDFSCRSLYLMLGPRERRPSAIRGEVLDPSFWIATPRSQVDLLKRSYIQAFSSLFTKYSDEDIDTYVGTLKDIEKEVARS
jgi:hypothetical protein